MNWLDRILGRRPRSLPTKDEIAVLGIILSGGDPRLRLVHAQLAEAPEIIRENPAQDHFRATPASTKEDRLFPLEVQRLESDWVRLVEQASGRELEFRAVIGPHGFLMGLEGRTLDGAPWPRDWSVRIEDADVPSQPLITLPSAERIERFEREARQRLGEWLGTPVLESVRVSPPGTEAALASRERSLGGRFPPGYRKFLSITDGVRVAGLDIFGHSDARTINTPHLAALMVAWDADNQAEYPVAVALDGEDEAVYRVDPDNPEAVPTRIAESFADYVRHYVELDARVVGRRRRR